MPPTSRPVSPRTDGAPPRGSYAALRVHGWHSLLTGVDAPEVLLKRAQELGLSALALTDVDTLSGVVEFLQAHARMENLGGQPPPRALVGAELSDPGGKPGRVIALVAEEIGWGNLCRLVSARRLGDDPGDAEAELNGPEDFDLAAAARRWHRGLFLLVDHPRLAFALAGRVPAERLLVAISPAALAKVSKRRSTRTRVVDGETTPSPLEEPKCPPPARAVPAEVLVETARTLGLATVAAADVYGAHPEARAHQHLRTAIKHNALSCDLPEEWLAEEPLHLLSTEEIARRFQDLVDAPGPFGKLSQNGSVPALLARTELVANACRYTPPLGGVLFPEVELKEHESAYSRLSELAFDGARKRYRPLHPEVIRRLDFELRAIEDLGFAPYFLLVQRIVDFARDEGIPHVGRGSAADSLVAYCLGMTDADPLRYRLPFERFLNPSRKDRPDIDLDFCWRRRDEVIAHIWDAFGTERTAMIATLNRFRLRAAFREAALATGLPPAEINRWSRRLPWSISNAGSEATAFDGSTESRALGDEEGEDGVGSGEDGAEGFETLPDTSGGALRSSPGWAGVRDGAAGNSAHRASSQPQNPIARALASTPECRDFPFDDPRWQRVLDTAAALIDAPRHLGLHPGGVVVAPGKITDTVPCQRAAKGVVITQFDKDAVEAIGLVKMDLLGNRALTVLDDCLQLLHDQDIHPDLANLDEDDPPTAELLARGGTLGCFQIESPGMRHLLQQTAASTMDDVIQAVALIRPGPAGSGMKDAYVRRFRGVEEPTPPHPRLVELLRETHGVLLYQEDIMQAVALMAGLDLAQADELRRALAKRRGDVLERMHTLYREGCLRNGVSEEQAASVWERIVAFASFGFCKAHAVTYGRISYRAAWLKAHFPAEYLVSFLNSHTGYYEARVYVEEARRLGVPILPPDINRSAANFSLDRSGDPPALRVGLAMVKGISSVTLDGLFKAREHGGAFLSLPDLLGRTLARVDELEKLIQAGALDAFDRTRPEMLWRLHLLRTPLRRPPRGVGLDHTLLASCGDTPQQRERRSARDGALAQGGWGGKSIGVGALHLKRGQTPSLFADPETPALALPRLPELDPITRGRLELELLGLTTARHPTLLFPCEGEKRARDSRRKPPRIILCGNLARHGGREVTLRGWLAASRRVRTDNGRWMRFVTLEDTSGLAEVVLFPDVYERDGHRLTNRGPFLITGTAEDQMGACTLHARAIY